MSGSDNLGFLMWSKGVLGYALEIYKTVLCHAKETQASRFVRKKAHSEQEGLVLFPRDGYIRVA
jgi:hypothetical protein